MLTDRNALTSSSIENTGLACQLQTTVLALYYDPPDRSDGHLPRRPPSLQSWRSQASGNFSANSRLVWDSHKVLNYLADTNKVNLIWVPRHGCGKGSITAEGHARLGAKTASVSPQLIVNICKSFIKRKLGDWTPEAHIE